MFGLIAWIFIIYKKPLTWSDVSLTLFSKSNNTNITYTENEQIHVLTLFNSMMKEIHCSRMKQIQYEPSNKLESSEQTRHNPNNYTQLNSIV